MAAVAEGTYVIRSALDHNKAMDAYGIGSVKNGTNIQLCSYNETNILIYQLHRGNNQKWKLERASSSQPPSQTSQADAMVNMAKSQVGIKERSAGSDDILCNDWYYGRRVKNSKAGFHPWCASFVSWCGYQTGILNSVIPKTAGTTNMKNGLISRGGTQHLRNSGYRPVHGNTIFFGINAGQHVGIVDYTSDNTVYYIDGNNTTTTPHGVKYSSCSLSYKSLQGFVTPKYQR